jgi:hypothetical protein
MKQLRTAEKVIEALGGLDRVCELTGANLKQAWNWYGRAGTFPSNTYWVMERALRRRGFAVDPRLFKMKGLDRAA